MGEELEFFGRKARLPVGHARLALHAGVPLAVAVTRRTGEGTYAATMLDFFEPYSTGNDTQDAIDLSQRVITVFEGYLRQHPEEWLMFFPVWGRITDPIRKRSILNYHNGEWNREPCPTKPGEPDLATNCPR